MTTVTEVQQSPKMGRSERRAAAAFKKGRSAIPPVRGLIAIVIVLAVWQVAAGPSFSFAFPPPSRWFEQLWSMGREGLLVPATLNTLRTFVCSLALSLVLGVLLGALVGSRRRLDQAISPVTDFFRALPPPVIVAVVMLVVGVGFQAGLLIIVTGAFWPIMLNTAVGMRSLSPLRREMSGVLELSLFRRISRVLLPSLTPHILLGVKVASALAFVITLYIELLGVTDGLGTLLVTRQRRYDSGGTWGLLLLIGVLGYLNSIVISRVERFALRNWPR